MKVVDQRQWCDSLHCCSFILHCPRLLNYSHRIFPLGLKVLGKCEGFGSNIGLAKDISQLSCTVCYCFKCHSTSEGLFQGHLLSNKLLIHKHVVKSQTGQ